MQAYEEAPRRRQTQLLDFDDGVLLQVLKHLTPLPDLFNVAQACWRFRQLTSDKRMWLLVAPNQLHPEQTPSGRCSGPVYATLAAAVACSRPGDTIWLAPNMVHSVADVRIRCPIHLMGGGKRPEDTILACPKGAETALDFGATAKLANLSIQSHMAACVLHRRGGLRVERCVLQCRADGLEHLLAPLVTLAAEGAAGKSVLSSMVQAPACTVIPQPLAAAAVKPLALQTTLSTPPRLQAGIGRLSVVETRLEGGSRAVQCFGTGRLMGVRVIYEAHATFFWLEVDSAMPGRYEQGMPGLARYQGGPLAAAGAGAAVLMPLVKQEPLAVVKQERQPGHAAQEQNVQQLHSQQPSPQDLSTTTATSWGARHGRSAPSGSSRSSSSNGSTAAGPATASEGLARIHAVLGKRLTPDVLAAHLQARSQRQRSSEHGTVKQNQEPEQ